MNSQLIVSGIFLLLFLVLIIFAHVLYKTRVSSETSRKFLHLGGGTLALFLPTFISSHWWVLGICSVAFLFLLITWLRKLLPAIHQTKRPSIGSLLFPIPIYLCFFFAARYNNSLLFYIPVSLLTFSDTAAEWGGKKW